MAFGLTGNVLINEDPRGLLLMNAHVQKTGEVLVSIRDAYAYGRNGLQLEGTSSTNQLDWLVCLAISFGLRKAWQCFCTFQLSIR